MKWTQNSNVPPSPSQKRIHSVSYSTHTRWHSRASFHSQEFSSRTGQIPQVSTDMAVSCCSQTLFSLGTLMDTAVLAGPEETQGETYPQEGWDCKSPAAEWNSQHQNCGSQPQECFSLPHPTHPSDSSRLRGPGRGRCGKAPTGSTRKHS